MCNLYNVSPKGDIETYFRTLAPEYYPTKPVGPFGQGVFLRRSDEGLSCHVGQWGMIAPGSKTARPASRAILTNNARIESVAERRTYRAAWESGQRCLIPAEWYQEPNWETGKAIMWRLRRADGLPWAIAGLWSEWADPSSGELVLSYTMLTCNCDGHPLLGRLHKPDPNLPDDQQDKRAVAHIEPSQWEAWLYGSTADALGLIQPQSAEVFDQGDADRTDQVLRQMQLGQQSLL